MKKKQNKQEKRKNYIAHNRKITEPVVDKILDLIKEDNVMTGWTSLAVALNIMSKFVLSKCANREKMSALSFLQNALENYLLNVLYKVELHGKEE